MVSYDRFYESIRLRELPQFPGEYEYVSYSIRQLVAELIKFTHDPAHENGGGCRAPALGGAREHARRARDPSHASSARTLTARKRMRHARPSITSR